MEIVCKIWPQNSPSPIHKQCHILTVDTFFMRYLEILIIIAAAQEKSERFNSKAAEFSLHAEQLCRVAEVKLMNHS